MRGVTGASPRKVLKGQGAQGTYTVHGTRYMVHGTWHIHGRPSTAHQAAQPNEAANHVSTALMLQPAASPAGCGADCEREQVRHCDVSESLGMMQVRCEVCLQSAYGGGQARGLHICIPLHPVHAPGVLCLLLPLCRLQHIQACLNLAFSTLDPLSSAKDALPAHKVCSTTCARPHQAAIGLPWAFPAVHAHGLL